jgi:hypothetical protein
MLRRIGVALGLLAVAAGVAAVALTTTPGRGYFGPVFSPDGASVYVLVRDVTASVVGLGYDSFTPPASVWIHHDRFSLIAIRIADHAATVVREFPASPLEGTRISAYHGAIFGEASGHLRWADTSHLEYELTVTRADTPSSRTFVWRHRWNPTTGVTEDSTAWKPGTQSLSGDEPSQLSGNREVIGVRGPEGLPCAVVLLRTGEASASALADSRRCGDRYASGFTRDALESRREAIEHVAMLEKTYADLVAEGRAQGLSEGAAMLQAGKGMQRLGLYPKTPTITAVTSACDALQPVFHISDEEFRVGLFQDIQQAIDHPGEAADFNGNYVTHRDYATSRVVNDFLTDRSHREFLVDGRGGCWRLSIDHR